MSPTWQRRASERAPALLCMTLWQLTIIRRLARRTCLAQRAPRTLLAEDATKSALFSEVRVEHEQYSCLPVRLDP